MTSGRSSPPPSNSPSLSQRPFLMTAVQAPKKTVDFENLPTKNDSEDTKSITDPENLTLIKKGSRLTEPRMSLLGKPLHYNVSRGDARYRRMQSRIYNFLERPTGVPILYHMLVFLMVFTCLVLSVFSTIEPYEEISADILTYMESFVVVWFAIEFGLRLWSSGCRSRYQGYIGRLKFLRCPFCLIDIVTIVASIVVLILARSRGQVFATSALRGLRFFQILRMVRMDRRGGTWKLLGSVVYAHRQELITTLYIGFLGWFFASFLVFLAEKDVNKKFNNFAQALWWGVITLCTVGYGDMVPETWQGKMIASFCSLLGISFFALPAGILGSGFALKVQQQQRQKHMIRRRQPAAILIQSVWRCYAADEQSMSVATWKIHQIPLPSPSSTKSQDTDRVGEKIQTISSVVRVSSSFRHNTSFVSKLPTIRRHKSHTYHTPSMHKGPPKQTFVDINSSAENLGISSSGSRNVNLLHSEDSIAETMLPKRHSDDEEDVPRLNQLTSQHKEAIRAIRKLKYFVARKKFREALKPYDVKDVIEQYSSGHADILNRVKNLQFRLEQILGKQGSKAKDVYASKISLASRVVKVERQVDDIESKLDQLLELYIEDRKKLFALSSVHESNGDKSLDGSDPTSPNLGTTSATDTKPKPILVNKRPSKPTSPKLYQTVFADRSPTSVARRPMHRGYSDVGSRIKKRVMLSSVSSNYISPSGSPSPPHDDEVVIIVPTLNVSQAGSPTLSTVASSGDTFCVSGLQSREKELGRSKSGTESPESDQSDSEETCPRYPSSEHSAEILITPTTLENIVQNDDPSLALSKSETRKYV